jgi:hypothetical protein
VISTLHVLSHEGALLLHGVWVFYERKENRFEYFYLPRGLFWRDGALPRTSFHALSALSRLHLFYSVGKGQEIYVKLLALPEFHFFYSVGKGQEIYVQLLALSGLHILYSVGEGQEMSNS